MKLVSKDKHIYYTHTKILKCIHDLLLCLKINEKPSDDLICSVLSTLWSQYPKGTSSSVTRSAFSSFDNTFNFVSPQSLIHSIIIFPSEHLPNFLHPIILFSSTPKYPSTQPPQLHVRIPTPPSLDLSYPGVAIT